MRRTRIASLVLFGLLLTTWAVLASGPAGGTAFPTGERTLIGNGPNPLTLKRPPDAAPPIRSAGAAR